MATGINVSKSIKVLDEGVQITPDVSQINFTGGVTATASGNNVTVNVPAAGITVGTTPVTSGTDGRVFFQAGGVVQQDASFLFDGTNKTLTNYGKGAVISNTSFGIGVFQNGTGLGTQNTAIGWGAANYLTTGSNNTMIGYRAGGGILASNFTGNSNVLIGNNSGLYLSSGIQNTFVGNSTGTSITTGSYNTIIGHYIGSLSAALAQNVIISDGAGVVSLWKNGSHFNGFGYNPLTDTLGARLDVRAQGALSTDIAFRVRNSGNTVNSVEYNGDGSKYWRAHSGDMHLQFDPVNSRIHLKRTGTYLIQTDNAVTELQILCNSGNLQLKGGSKQLHIYNGGNFHLGGTALLAGSGDGNLIFQNGTAPSTNLTDRHYYYSADIVAGNAAPHFRTENGNIVKLYRQDLPTNPTTAEIATFLSNLGLANLI